MAVAYKDRSAAELQEEYRAVKAQFDALKSRELKLNMSRGKPSKAQLDMVSDIMDVFKTPEDYISDGIDVRNYGELSGLPAAKRLFAEILGCKPEECFIGGNASLTLMYDTISKASRTVCSIPARPGAAWTRSSGSAPRRAMTAISRSRSRSAAR